VAEFVAMAGRLAVLSTSWDIVPYSSWTEHVADHDVGYTGRYYDVTRHTGGTRFNRHGYIYYLVGKTDHPEVLAIDRLEQGLTLSGHEAQAEHNLNARQNQLAS